MERRYAALRVVGTIYKTLGILAGLLAVLAVLGIFAGVMLGGRVFGDLPLDPRLPFLRGLGPNLVGGLLFGIAGLLYGGFIALTLYAAGEGIYLLLALEENTRATASLLRIRGAAAAPAPAPREAPPEEPAPAS